MHLALDAPTLCWWQLGEENNLSDLITEQGNAAKKQHTWESGIIRETVFQGTWDGNSS